MPSAEEAGYTRDEEEKVSLRLKAALKKQRIYCPDLRAWNVGTYRGRPVVLDYGMGVRCRVDHKQVTLG